MTPLSPEKAEKSVLEEFEKFRSKIEPTEKEKSSISASHTKMRITLENSTELRVLETFLTGSYARQTMIRPLKDVDFFVKVHYAIHKNDRPMQLLQKVRKVLRSAYPLTSIAIAPPCVKVKFNFCYFEVVPAIGIKGNADLFEIPSNSGRGWQLTYPKIPDNWMTQENKKAGGLFKPTIKMLKRWRDVHRIPLRSFHLEMLARLSFEYYKIENYAQGVLAFFRNTKDLLDYYKYIPFVKEPGRSDVYVDQYLYDDLSKLRLIKRKIDLHCGYAQKAFYHMSKGHSGASKRIWRNILGNSFFAPSTVSLFPVLPQRLLPPFIVSK